MKSLIKRLRSTQRTVETTMLVAIKSEKIKIRRPESHTYLNYSKVKVGHAQYTEVSVILR